MEEAAFYRIIQPKFQEEKMKRKIISLAIILLLSTVFISNTLASNGIQIGNVGARSTAMASCFRGLADDWSALFFNPAGLTQLGSKWTIGFSGGLIMPSGSYNAHDYPATHFQFAGMYTNERDLVDRTFFVPSGGIFYKPSDRIVFGIGVYAPFGLGTEWDLVMVPPAYGNPDAISKTNEEYSDLQIINIQPTVAFKLSDKISLGVGFSYIHGKMVLDMIQLPYHPLAQQRIVLETNLDGTGSTFGANAGLLFEFSEKFALGLSGRFALSNLSFDGDMGLTVGLPAVLGGVNQSQSGIAEAELPLPWTIGAGIAFKPSAKFTMTADVSMTNWDSWDVITIKNIEGILNPLTNQPLGTEELDQKWENTIEAGFGLEYMAMDNGTNRLFLRGGFYTAASPVPDATMNPTILDPNRRYVFTGGIGFDLPKIGFNLAAEYIMFGEKDVADYEWGALEEGLMVGNYAGIYNFNALVFTFGTSIKL